MPAPQHHLSAFLLLVLPPPAARSAVSCTPRYDAHLINIMAGEQFSSGFVAVNPNSKIPCSE